MFRLLMSSLPRMTEPLEQFPDLIEKLEAVGATNYQQHLLPRSE
jgi:hypothetical protein